MGRKKASSRDLVYQMGFLVFKIGTTITYWGYYHNILRVLPGTTIMKKICKMEKKMPRPHTNKYITIGALNWTYDYKSRAFIHLIPRYFSITAKRILI